MNAMKQNTGWKLALIAVAVIGLVVLVRLASGGGAEAKTTVVPTGGETWTCSMHPQVRMPKPGFCPICSMPLVKIKRSESPAAGTNATERTMLELSDHARAMASVETAPAEMRRIERELRMVGKVQYNESSLATVSSRVEGYTERLYVDYTGVEVNVGDHLVDIYSPDLVLAQKEFLLALADPGNTPLIESARLKLLRWGLTDAQVKDLEQSRKLSERLTLFSPIKGTVTEKMIVQNSMVKPGEPLYRLADLSSVWIYLDLYESDLPWVQYGQPATITAEAHPGRTWTGRVWFINPVLTEESRTVKVLLNIGNEDKMLKPGMYVNAVVRAGMLAGGKPAPSGVEGKFTCPMHPSLIQDVGGACPLCHMNMVQIPGKPGGAISEEERETLAVPISAVLDGGIRKLVYVERKKGEFVAVEVTTGPRADGYYPVLTGLAAGDRVAVRGNFLLDSQFQISGLPSLFFASGQAPPAGHAHGGPAPVPTSAPTIPQPAHTDHTGHTPPPAPAANKR